MKNTDSNYPVANKATSRFLNPWIILLAGWCFYLYEYILRVTPSVITHSLMSDFGVTAAALGGLSSMYYLAYVPLQFPCGIITDKYGPRVVVTVSAFLCVSGALLFSISESLGVGQFGRFLIGAGSACAYVCCGRIAADWFSPNRFASIMGLTMMMGTLGGIFGGRPYALLVEYVGWRTSFLYAAGIGLFVAVFAWMVIREKTPPQKNPAPIATSLLSGLKTIMKDPKQWLVGLYACMMYLPLSAFAELWGVPYLMQSYGISSATAGIGTTMVFLGMAMGSATGPLLSNMLKSRLIVMRWAAILTLVFFTLVLYIPNLSLNTTFLLLFLVGLANGGQILYFAVAKELSPKGLSGTSVGFTNGLTMSSGLIFQPLLGVLIDYAWSGAYDASGAPDYNVSDYKFAFTFVLAALLFGIVILKFIKETYAENDD